MKIDHVDDVTKIESDPNSMSRTITFLNGGNEIAARLVSFLTLSKIPFVYNPIDADTSVVIVLKEGTGFEAIMNLSKHSKISLIETESKREDPTEFLIQDALTVLRKFGKVDVSIKPYRKDDRFDNL